MHFYFKGVQQLKYISFRRHTRVRLTQDMLTTMTHPLELGHSFQWVHYSILLTHMLEKVLNRVPSNTDNFLSVEQNISHYKFNTSTLLLSLVWELQFWPIGSTVSVAFKINLVYRNVCFEPPYLINVQVF